MRRYYLLLLRATFTRIVSRVDWAMSVVLLLAAAILLFSPELSDKLLNLDGFDRRWALVPLGADILWNLAAANYENVKNVRAAASKQQILDRLDGYRTAFADGAKEYDSLHMRAYGTRTGEEELQAQYLAEMNAKGDAIVAMRTEVTAYIGTEVGTFYRAAFTEVRGETSGWGTQIGKASRAHAEFLLDLMGELNTRQ